MKKGVIVVVVVAALIGGIILYKRAKKSNGGLLGGTKESTSGGKTTIAVDLGLPSGRVEGIWVKPKNPADRDKFKVGDSVVLNGGTYKDVAAKIHSFEDNATAGKLIHLSGFKPEGKQLVPGTLSK